MLPTSSPPASTLPSASVWSARCSTLSVSREQRWDYLDRICNDGLGQHLTGVAFMGKVLQDRLAEASLAETAEAAKIVSLVNDSIKMTRELARGLAAGSLRSAQVMMSASSDGPREDRAIYFM